MQSSAAITHHLMRLGRGDPEAVHDLLPLVYPELRAVARRALRAEFPRPPVAPTSLVHEAYTRLFGEDPVPWEGRAHFYGIAGRVMRQILVEHARARHCRKRGGAHQRISGRFLAAPAGLSALEVLALDEALDALAAHDARKAQVVELRFFAGLTEEEIAVVLEVTPRTVRRDWRYSQAWLYRRLDPPESVTVSKEEGDG